ncbi:MAG: acetate kinase, partial [Candidatus Cloacimonadaceae bacterium]
PSILFYLEERGYSMKDLNIMLNKKSGLLGLSGISSDLRDLEAAAEAGNANAIQALDAFAHRVKKYIGAYAACMVKVDLLIFTGGIGENGVNMRNRICNRLENIGIHISPELNQEVGSQPGVISKAYSPVTILVIPTNEELQIAMDTHELVSVS